MLSGDDLEAAFCITLNLAGVSESDQKAVHAFLAPLRCKSDVTHFHYEHSLRVGRHAWRIAQFVHLDQKALLLAGALHDLGKCMTALETLGKTEVWSAKDYEEIRHHVVDGYRLLKGRFDFSAETILWHHRFQKDGYPKKLPKPLHEYSEGTKLLIAEHGRMLAIADVYDALHRVNSKFGEARALTGAEIKEKMLQFNPDRKILIEDLYKADICSE